MTSSICSAASSSLERIVFLLFRHNPEYYHPTPTSSLSGEIDINDLKSRPEKTSKVKIQVKTTAYYLDTKIKVSNMTNVTDLATNIPLHFNI